MFDCATRDLSLTLVYPNILVLYNILEAYSNMKLGQILIKKLVTDEELHIKVFYKIIWKANKSVHIQWSP